MSAPSSPTASAWAHYCERFDDWLPSPRDLAGPEHSTLETALLRIPLLLLYAPFYYLLFWLGAIPGWLYYRTTEQ